MAHLFLWGGKSHFWCCIFPPVDTGSVPHTQPCPPSHGAGIHVLTTPSLSSPSSSPPSLPPLPLLDQVLYVPDSQRREGEDDSSSLFTDDVSPKSAPPELKAFLFPATQRPPAAADGRGTGDPLRPEGGEHMTQQGKDASELCVCCVCVVCVLCVLCVCCVCVVCVYVCVLC